MDDEKGNISQEGIGARLEELLTNDEIKISHRNSLWFLYRLLSENIISTEEFDNIWSGLH